MTPISSFHGPAALGSLLHHPKITQGAIPLRTYEYKAALGQAIEKAPKLCPTATSPNLSLYIIPRL